jgi:AcrR family transcriptional regulator
MPPVQASERNEVEPAPTATLERPLRADAFRNREKLIEAGREAFAQAGSGASLEDIARRAGVGIGTLYRHFPTRLALVEAIYVDEVQALCDSAATLVDRPPWDALVEWLRRFVRYVATKQALAELFANLGADAAVFRSCREAVYAVGEPLLERAQLAGVVRPDTGFTELVQMVGAIAKIPNATPAEIERILDVALDGLRYRSAASPPSQPRSETSIA